MITFSISLKLNHSAPTASSPCGRRSTFGFCWSSPSYSRVIFKCVGKRRLVISVLHKQSQPNSWMPSLSYSVFKLLHSLKVAPPIFFRDGGATNVSKPERQKASDCISLTVEPRSKMTCYS